MAMKFPMEYNNKYREKLDDIWDMCYTQPGVSDSATLESIKKITQNHTRTGKHDCHADCDEDCPGNCDHVIESWIFHGSHFDEIMENCIHCEYNPN